MNNKSKLFMALGVGALAGVALTLFLTSEQGKKILERLKTGAEELGEDLIKLLADLEKEATGGDEK